MKRTIATLAAIGSIVCLSYVPRVEARSIRIDNPGASGCQLVNWGNPQTLSGPSPFNPGGISLDPTSGTDYVITCTSNSDNSLDTTDVNSFFNVNVNNGAPYPIVPNEYYGATQNAADLATSGVLYQFVSNGSGINNNSAGYVDAEAINWTLANGDTELELDGWCGVGSAGASVTFGNTTFGGGCNSSTQDLVFNSSKKLVGYVTDSTGNLAFVSANSLPTDWTQTPPVPLPSSAVLFGSGIGFLWLLKRRHKMCGTELASGGAAP